MTGFNQYSSLRERFERSVSPDADRLDAIATELETMKRAYPRLCEVLRELVEAVDEQQDGLDPTVRLVQAMRDAKSWVDSPALSSSSPKET